MKQFDTNIAKLSNNIINATMNVFLAIAMSPQFMPTAKKFHYQFNLRDFSRIIQNIMLAQPAIYKGNPLGVLRMWAHECHRTWRDRLITEEDNQAYLGFMGLGMKEFTEVKPDDRFPRNVGVPR